MLHNPYVLHLRNVSVVTDILWEAVKTPWLKEYTVFPVA